MASAVGTLGRASAVGTSVASVDRQSAAATLSFVVPDVVERQEAVCLNGIG